MSEPWTSRPPQRQTRDELDYMLTSTLYFKSRKSAIASTQYYILYVICIEYTLPKMFYKRFFFHTKNYIWYVKKTDKPILILINHKKS